MKPIPADQCHHIKEDGHRCGSPHMKGKPFCYYHNKLHQDFLLPGQPMYEGPSLDNLHGTELALTHIYRAQAKRIISAPEAKAMLFNIQLAQQNLRLKERHSPIHPDPDSVEIDYTPGMRHVLFIEEEEEPCGADIPARDEECGTDIPACDPEPLTFPKLPPHPLSDAIGLRPWKCRPRQSDEAPTWQPLTKEELDEICLDIPNDETLANTEQRHNIRRLRISSALQGNESPTTRQLMQAVARVDADDAERALDREQENRRAAAYRKAHPPDKKLLSRG